MPVQRVTKNGKTYYRWGNHGKVYPTREQAEAQGRAAYAAGYKHKENGK
jgi:uncharacterized protein